MYGLEKYNQFINWIQVGEDKFPTNPYTGKVWDAHDPLIHVSYSVAEAAARSRNQQIGFVITDKDPLFFIDIDHGLNEDKTAWRQECQDVVDLFPGAFIETSQSGGQVRIKALKNDASFDFVATRKRYVALTFRDAKGDVNTNHKPALAKFMCDKGLLGDPKQTLDPLIKKALKARSPGGTFGVRCSFRDLWYANEKALHKFYPDPHDKRPYDKNRADSALAQHLAFWFSGDPVRIREQMEKSALNRQKWTDRPDYVERTIAGVVARQTKFYKSDIHSDKPLRDGLQYLSPSGQAEFFAGCVYIREVHKILVPDGGMLKPEQFKVQYGGYLFALDTINEKTTDNAWTAFTESRAINNPKVVGTRFLPKEPFGVIIDDHINTYKPHHAERVKGESDRRILLSYMAACVKEIGTKFQWCPVIQGVQGNGKTLLYTVLEYAIGPQYCHQQDPEDIKSSFNAWVEGHLLVAIEEIRTKGRYEVADRLKTLITNSRVPDR